MGLISAVQRLGNTAPKKHRSVGEPLTTLCPNWPARNQTQLSRIAGDVVITSPTHQPTFTLGIFITGSSDLPVIAASGHFAIFMGFVRGEKAGLDTFLG